MIVFLVIMYSQGYTSIHPHSTWMCHFWLSYSLLSLHLWSASPSPCWLLWVCIHTHRQIVEYSGSIVTWKRRGLKMKTCLKKKTKTPSHNCGSPAVHRLGCSLRTKPRKRSFPLCVKNVLVLPVLGLISSSPLHHVKTESGLSDLPIDNTKMVFCPAFNTAMIAGEKKKNPSRRSVCVTPQQTLHGAHFGDECVLCVCVQQGEAAVGLCL